MYTEILFAAFLSVLCIPSFRRGPLWLLPILMCLWTNLHLGFIAGLGLCALMLLWSLAMLRSKAFVQPPSSDCDMQPSVDRNRPGHAAQSMGRANLCRRRQARRRYGHAQQVDSRVVRVAHHDGKTGGDTQLAGPEQRLWWLILWHSGGPLRGVYAANRSRLLLAASVYVVMHALRMRRHLLP